MFVGQSNGGVSVARLGSNSARATAVLDVSVASPEGVLLTFAVDDVFEAFVHQHDSSALSLSVLECIYGLQEDLCG